MSLGFLYHLWLWWWTDASQKAEASSPYNFLTIVYGKKTSLLWHLDTNYLKSLISKKQNKTKNIYMEDYTQIRDVSIHLQNAF